jgi:hypothetical protein
MNQIVDKRSATAVHKSLYAALAAAQAEMGPALKDSTNPAFRTRYADRASVMAACLPALNAHGIAVIQPPFDDGENRFVKTILVHGETGETTECRVPLIIGKNDMQGYGSAVTYARRYGLMAMAGIAPDDDDGNAAAAAAPKKEAPAPKQESRRQPEDSGADFERAVSDAVKAIARETTAESLGAFWANLNATAKAVAADPRVIKAKDGRKSALTRPSADICGDEIPY